MFLRSIKMAPCWLLTSALLTMAVSPSGISAPAKAAPAKPAHQSSEAEKAKTPADKKPETKAELKPEPVIDNAVSVTPDELVNKPAEFLGKNVKFNANFFAWSNLGLDYKPAFRSSKTHLSFLILRPSSHIPLSELKLAMMIPKEKDPDAALFAILKDGDQVELIGKVFSTALDDPWVEVFRLKKLSSSDDKDKKTASADAGSKSEDSDKKTEKESKPGDTKGSGEKAK